MRLHGNASEYVPLAIVLMVAYEINGGPHIALHVIGIALVAGRLLHASGMWRTPKPNLVRASGQMLTWLAIMALAALNLWQLA